jgi:hypothetical protein
MYSATGPYTAWPHRIDIGKDVPWWDHAYCFEQPLLDLASGSFPTGLCQDPEIDLPASDFEPRSEIDAEMYARCEYLGTMDSRLDLTSRCPGRMAKWTYWIANYSQASRRGEGG